MIFNYRFIDYIHVVDNEISRNDFDYDYSEIEFDIDGLQSTFMVVKEFVLYPKFTGELTIKGPKYNYSILMTDEKTIQNYTGEGTDTNIKVCPFEQFKLMQTWQLHAYIAFGIYFGPLAILPLIIWGILLLINRSSKTSSEKSGKTKIKKDKKQKKK